MESDSKSSTDSLSLEVFRGFNRYLRGSTSLVPSSVVIVLSLETRSRSRDCPGSSLCSAMLKDGLLVGAGLFFLENERIKDGRFTNTHYLGTSRNDVH